MDEVKAAAPSRNGQTSLLVIFSILLLAIIGGTVVCEYLNLKKDSQPASVQPSSAPAQAQKAPPASPTPSFKPAINPDALATLAKMRYASDSSLYITTSVQTKILEVAKNKQFRGKTFPYAFKVQMKTIDSNGQAVTANDWNFYPADMVNKIKVKIVTNKQESAATLDDIKVGDNVTLKETYDPYYSPTDPKQLISYTIEIAR